MSEHSESGIKHDEGKLRFDLLPVEALEAEVAVLTHGAKKYADDNWKHVPDRKNRYYAACMRHLVAWRGGEQYDQETGINHLAHAKCCLSFLIWGDENEKKDHYD